MATFIDLQFIQTESGYILKELAIIDKEMRLSHYIIKPPFKYSRLTDWERKQLRWLQQNYSSLNWDSGNFAYNSIGKILARELRYSTEIYVKGYEKKIWLKKYGISAVNIEDLGYKFQLRKLEGDILCRCHTDVCAMRNVFHIIKWFKLNKCNDFYKGKIKDF